MRKYGGAARALEELPELSLKGGRARPVKLMPQSAAEQALGSAEKMGARFVVAGETGYPPLLQHIDDAPPLLCVQGVPELAELESVAIVGSRNASAAGLKLARQLAAALAEEGYLVTSGLARGIDTAAHGAVQEARTAAVIAGGIDSIYPPENEALQRRIAAQGLLITEFLPGAAPQAKNFPRRNRIISGMSIAVIVVEAALRSGSLITARTAAEQGRDVYAVPGSPLDPRAEGTNRLIRDGAAIVTSVQDVIDGLKAGRHSSQGSLFEGAADEVARDVDDGDRKRILSLLSPTPVDIDDIVRESGLRPAAVLAVLLELELAGRCGRSARHQVYLQS
jgi:DNA processing protein